MTARELPPGDWRLRVYGRGPSSGTDRRRKPRVAERARIIAQQGNRCLYCEIPIGTIIDRRGKDVVLRTNWDHFIPYAYVARNPHDNWVLACHVCNGIKRGRIFKTVQEVRNTVLPERLDKGYEDPLDVLRRLGELPRLPFPDRLRSVNGGVVHYARTSRTGYWETACGQEKAAALWRTPGTAGTHVCEHCVVASGIAATPDDIGQQPA